MLEWCEATRYRLESLFLRGGLTFQQYADMAQYAEGLALRAEAGLFEWGTIEAEEMLSNRMTTVAHA